MITAQESTTKILDMPPFSSWEGGRPPEGWFSSPLDERAGSFYREQGFLVLDRVLNHDEVTAISDEAAKLCRNADGLIDGIAPAPAHVSDDEVMQNTLCIHFPHKLSGLMSETLSHPRIVQALRW